MANKKAYENLKGHKFKKAPQGLDEAKSKGQIKKSKTLNVLATLRTEMFNRDIIPKILDVVQVEVEAGNAKNAIELLKITKEPEKQEINLNGDVGIQKVYVTKREQKKVKDHIAEVINEGVNNG